MAVGRFGEPHETACRMSFAVHFTGLQQPHSLNDRFSTQQGLSINQHRRHVDPLHKLAPSSPLPATAVHATAGAWSQGVNAQRHISESGRHLCQAAVTTLDAPAPSSVEEPSPAEQSTLATLGWPALCETVARFASTTLGRKAVQNLPVCQEQFEMELLVKETAAADKLEAEYSVEMDFGGTSTSQASEALKRCSRGGMLLPAQLKAVASTLTGASRLQKAVASGARTAKGYGYGSLFAALVDPTKDLQGHPNIVKAINACVNEEAEIADNASEEVRMTRGKLRALEGRLSNILKGHAGGGQVSEMGGRMCIVLPASGDGAPKGILLGTSPGGGNYYVEPPSAVPLNNDLGAARGEAAAAEEAVMWKLTGQISDDLEDIQAALDTVVWLDVVTARARYGRWIGGYFPSFVPVPLAGKASAKARKGNQAAEGQQEAAIDPLKAYSVRLKQLRHPLLLGRHLQEKEKAVQQQHKNKGLAQLRRLANRKQQTPEQSKEAQKRKDAEKEDAAVLANGPVAIDVCVRPDTRAVIITGPNTGGKTATLKAFGLAVLMGRAGLAIPAQDPVQLPAYSAVLADIGDEQSLSANLSTFSGHLRRIQAVRSASNSRSLVLLDEVGTGTEPVEGSALGVALLEALVKGGRGGAGFTMATTHHSSLTSLKFENSAFENASVEFDEQKLAPTYKLLWGVPGRSNALNIAAGLGLDPSIIQAARDSLGVQKAAVDSSIVQLEDLKRELDSSTSLMQELEQQVAAERERQAEQKQAALWRKHKDLAHEANTKLKLAEAIVEAVVQTRQTVAPEFQRQFERARLRAREKAEAGEMRKMIKDVKKAEVKKEKSIEKVCEEQWATVQSGWIPKPGKFVWIPSLRDNFLVTDIIMPTSKKKDVLIQGNNGYVPVKVSVKDCFVHEPKHWEEISLRWKDIVAEREEKLQEKKAKLERKKEPRKRPSTGLALALSQAREGKATAKKQEAKSLPKDQDVPQPAKSAEEQAALEAEKLQKQAKLQKAKEERQLAQAKAAEEAAVLEAERQLQEEARLKREEEEREVVAAKAAEAAAEEARRKEEEARQKEIAHEKFLAKWFPKAGEQVWMPRLNRLVKVVSAPKSRSEDATLTVAAGMLPMSLKLKEVQHKSQQGK